MKSSILPILLLSCILPACSMPWQQGKNGENTAQQALVRTVNDGDSVLVNYRLIQSGSVVDSKDNLTVTIGSHEPFMGLEKSLLGMKAGEQRSVLLGEFYLYGDARIQQDIKRTKLEKSDNSDSPAPFPPHKFKTGAIGTWNDKLIRIEKIGDDNVLVSYLNPHPLAGKSLTLEVEVKSIQ